MIRGALVVLGAEVVLVGCSAYRDSEPLNVIVSTEHVQVGNDRFQCVSELRARFEALDRTRTLAVQFPADAASDALKVAALLDRLGFTDVSFALASGHPHGWILYPPGDPNSELSSCKTDHL